MKSISTRELEACCSIVVDEVRRRREHVTITEKGKPVAKLVTVNESPTHAFGCMAGTAEIVGDVQSRVWAVPA